MLSRYNLRFRRFTISLIRLRRGDLKAPTPCSGLGEEGRSSALKCCYSGPSSPITWPAVLALPTPSRARQPGTDAFTLRPHLVVYGNPSSIHLAARDAWVQIPPMQKTKSGLRRFAWTERDARRSGARGACGAQAACQGGYPRHLISSTSEEASPR